MGSSVSSSSSKERYERARASGVLTLDGAGITSWKELRSGLRRAEGVRSASLSNNRLRKPVPRSLMQLPLWGTLRTLDLGGNGLRDASALGCLRAFSHGGGTLEERVAAVPFPLAPEDERLRAVATHPLERLVLSRNALPTLPPLLLLTFPRLQSLECAGNTVPLALPCGAARLLGNGGALERLDLSGSGLASFCVLAGPLAERTRVLPALRELLLAGNALAGTLALAPDADPRLVVLPKLKRLDASGNTGALQRVDPGVFTSAPQLGPLELAGAANEQQLRDQLAQTEEFREWQRSHAAVVNKKLANGGAAELL